jgi:hypothetical protein
MGDVILENVPVHRSSDPRLYDTILVLLAIERYGNL